MNPGDLVKRKPAMGKWVVQNPWMYTEEELEIGMVVELDALSLAVVLWPTFGLGWHKIKDLVKVS